MRPLQDNISPDDENENGNDDNNINASDSKVIIILYNRKNEKKILHAGLIKELGNCAHSQTISHKITNHSLITPQHS